MREKSRNNSNQENKIKIKQKLKLKYQNNIKLISKDVFCYTDQSKRASAARVIAYKQIRITVSYEAVFSMTLRRHTSVFSHCLQSKKARVFVGVNQRAGTENTKVLSIGKVNGVTRKLIITPIYSTT